MRLLDIRNLTVRFRTRNGAFTAVDGVDLSVDPDEVLAIVGESGSGKSVAMLAIMGLLPWTATITADRMDFLGQDLRALRPKARRALIGRDMAMIFQEPMSSLNPCFTVGFQIKEALKAHLDLSASARQARAVELLEQVGIPDPVRRLKMFPHQFSGGMSQRVMIAMAIACRPKLLIADEPTTALDVTIQAQILRLIRDIQKELGLAVIFITHDLGLVARIADRVAVMYAGKIVETAAALQLFENPQHPYTRGLLASIPIPGRTRPGEALGSIPGLVPSLVGEQQGCAFRNRCSQAIPACAQHVPEVEQGGHRTRCLFAAPDRAPIRLPESVRS